MYSKYIRSIYVLYVCPYMCTYVCSIQYFSYPSEYRVSSSIMEEDATPVPFDSIGSCATLSNPIQIQTDKDEK